MKKIIISLLSISVVTITIGFLLTTSSKSIANAETLIPAVTQHDSKRLNDLNIKLEKPMAKVIYSKEKAIEIAIANANGYASESKSIEAELQLITLPSFTSFSEKAKEKNLKLKSEGYLNATPVYIVSFKGVHGKGHAAHGGETPTFTELNVVVDANTGEVLLSFNYR
ncbi:MAG: PepSY domain-containing protein [Bacillota bacterium]